jgi:hypothetical protein
MLSKMRENKEKDQVIYLNKKNQRKRENYNLKQKIK